MKVKFDLEGLAAFKGEGGVTGLLQLLRFHNGSQICVTHTHHEDITGIHLVELWRGVKERDDALTGGNCNGDIVESQPTTILDVVGLCDGVCVLHRLACLRHSRIMSATFCLSDKFWCLGLSKSVNIIEVFRSDLFGGNRNIWYATRNAVGLRVVLSLLS